MMPGPACEKPGRLSDAGQKRLAVDKALKIFEAKATGRQEAPRQPRAATMSLPALQPGLRVLGMLRLVPAEHGVLRVEHDGFEPYLRLEELAIFDTGESRATTRRAVRRTGDDMVRKIAQAMRQPAAFSNGPPWQGDSCVLERD